MNDFWNGLSPSGQVFLVIAAVVTIFLLVRWAAKNGGFSGDSSGDWDSDSNDGYSPSSDSSSDGGGGD